MRQHMHTWTINEPHHHPFKEKVHCTRCISTNTLQNLDCFNHWVVALVADKLKRQILYVYFHTEKTRSRGNFPNHLTAMILQKPLNMHLWKGHTCKYQRACNNNHDLADTEHLWESHHKSIIFLKCISVVKYDLISCLCN